MNGLPKADAVVCFTKRLKPGMLVKGEGRVSAIEPHSDGRLYNVTFGDNTFSKPAEALVTVIRDA